MSKFKAALWAPFVTGPLLISVTATLGATAVSLAFAIHDVGLKSLVMLPLLIPAAVFWGFFIGWKVLLGTHILSSVLINSLAWYIDRASVQNARLRLPRIWWLTGAGLGLSIALLINIAIQVRSEGVLFFTRDGDGATLWRVAASLGCIAAGSGTLALWRRIAHGQVQRTSTSA